MENATMTYFRQIAKIAHEVNRSYCLAIGDKTQPTWERCPEWQRRSIIHGVMEILLNPNLTPRQSHAKWLELKKADGWSWGIKKDPIRKKHPCFLPFLELPTEQQAKDFIFGAVVKQLLQFGQAEEIKEGK